VNPGRSLSYKIRAVQQKKSVFAQSGVSYYALLNAARPAGSNFCCQQCVSNRTATVRWMFCLKTATDANSCKVLELSETAAQPNSATGQSAVTGRTLLTPRSTQLLMANTFQPLGKMTRTFLKMDNVTENVDGPR